MTTKMPRKDGEEEVLETFIASLPGNFVVWLLAEQVHSYFIFF
jgi:hypothetical protein